MTPPDKPGTPDEGKPADAQVEQEAADAKTQTPSRSDTAETEAAPTGDAPKPKRARRRKAEPAAAEAEGTAAERTGVDKPAAEASSVTEPTEDAVTDPPAGPAAPKRGRGPKPAPAGPTPRAQPAPRRRRRDRDAGGLVIVRAQARYVRSSARKARLVCDGIRGKSVAEARAILAFSPRDIAEAWTKLLESAVANAENNHDLIGEDLKVHAVYADEGPTIKRFRPRAMGRATQIRKRTSHLTIQLTPRN